MRRSAIVTGSAGFLGSRLSALLVDRGYHITAIDRSTVKQTEGLVSVTGDLATLDLDACVPEHDYEVCFHFAGPSSVPLSWEDPLTDFSGCLPGTLNLIQFLVNRHPSCQLLLSSSAAVYGNPDVLPVPESAQLRPISPYGIHKALSEHLCMHYSRLYSLPVRVLRIFSAYGLGLRRQLLWDTTRKLLDATATLGHEISLWGTGKESRDFIHVDDVAFAALSVAEARWSSLYEVVNIASGIELTIQDVAGRLCDHWGGNINPVFQGSNRQGDPALWRADISKLNNIGFFPSIDFDIGLKNYVEWVKSIENV
jgi:UDP-glucose 4-epimerase